MSEFDAQKIAAINSLEVVDYSCSGDECEYVFVDDTPEARKALLDAGFTEDQIAEAAGDDDFLVDGIDVAVLAFGYAGATYFVEGRLGFMDHEPTDEERLIDYVPSDAIRDVWREAGIAPGEAKDLLSYVARIETEATDLRATLTAAREEATLKDAAILRLREENGNLQVGLDQRAAPTVVRLRTKNVELRETLKELDAIFLRAYSDNLGLSDLDNMRAAIADALGAS